MPTTLRLLLSLALFATLTLAAPLPHVTPRPPASKPAPLVAVTKTDGTLLRGRLTSSDPDALTLAPSPTRDNPTPDPVTVPWPDVKSVSSGLTRAKALQLWKAEHAADLCPTCLGDRTVPCPTCHGTNRDPAARKDCPTCHGELLVPCKTPREKDGKIPCPNHCLQLTEGKWYKAEDGLLRRNFNYPGGYAWFSEHHLGHVIKVDTAAKTAVDLGTCPVCNGATTIPDPACQGTGHVPCPTCTNAKDAPTCPAHCDAGRTKCPTCDGTGLKKT